MFDLRIFLHTPYHPLDVLRKRIQEIANETLFKPNRDKNTLAKFKRRDEAGITKVKKLTIAYHRQKNIRDLICPSKLRETEEIQVSEIHKNLVLNNSNII